MVVRVARFIRESERFATGEYRWVLEAIRTVDGFVAAYHVLDDESGDSISISVFASEEAAKSAERAVGVARERLGRDASPPDEVHLWRVLDSVVS